MKMRLSFMVLLMSCAFVTANGQDRNFEFNLNYNLGFPLGTFNSGLINNTSPRGFSGNIMYNFTPHFAAGLMAGFQDYYQMFPRQLYNTGKTEQTSAVLTNSIQIVPIMARATYSPLNNLNSRVVPYVSLAAGFNFINNNQYLGEFSNGSDASAKFGGQAGLGVKIPVGRNRTWGFNVGGTYNLTPYNKFGVGNLNTANVYGGVYLGLH